MKYKNKTANINGIDFEIVIPRSNFPRYSNAIQYQGLGLEHYYKKPSHIKELIWETWKRWAYECDDVITLGISSANSNRFTITGTYIDDDNTKWVLYITQAHNKMILAK